MKKANPGTVSAGTLRTLTLMERFMDVLKDCNPTKFKELEAQIDLIDGAPGMDEEILAFLYYALWPAMEDIAPDGHYFGSHPGDASDIGYWPGDEEGTL